MVGTGVSIIALVSALTNQPCADVFQKTAEKQIQFDSIVSESMYLREFAEEACKTSNPDIIWQIAQVETNFHFEIVRFNETSQVLKGKQAMQYLKGLQKSKAPVNIDIGVMQVNWFFHRDYFSKDPILQLSPAMQVNYLVNYMAPTVTKMCGQNWIGCYHNPSNGPRAQLYSGWVFGARSSLKSAALAYMKERGQKQIPLAGTILTPQQSQEFFKTANFGINTPIAFVEPEVAAPQMVAASAVSIEPSVQSSELNVGDRSFSPVTLRDLARSVLSQIVKASKEAETKSPQATKI